MAVITKNETIGSSSTMASAEEIRTAFTEPKRELSWLAQFLTDDELMASACVTHARELSANNSANNKEDQICQECARSWTRETTIRSALDLKRARIAELSPAYESADCSSQEHPPLSSEWIELVVRESEVVRSRLDSLCRFVLVLCGVGNHSVRDAALLLGISQHSVEVAYAIVLELLDVIYCQALVETYGCAAA